MSYEDVNRWYMRLLKPSSTLFKLIFKIKVFNIRKTTLPMILPWTTFPMRNLHRNHTKKNFLNIFVCMCVCVYIFQMNKICGFCMDDWHLYISSYIFSCFCFYVMSFTVLHGIVVLSLTKTVKYSLAPLSFCPIFKHFFLLQTKVCNVVILLIAHWFGSWFLLL